MLNFNMLPANWSRKLNGVVDRKMFECLAKFLEQERRQKKIIYPNLDNIFYAFHCTPFDKLKVVFIGQDPYHGPGQAHGLLFSVLPGVKIPPSLKNIFKELCTDLGVPISSHGYLRSWADQGVFLLNSVLTVEKGQPGSHRNRGWEDLTDKIVEVINKRTRPVIFVLWGNYAQSKSALIDFKKHLVLVAAHPSPLSAYRGFFGCKHFSKINHCLRKWGEKEIDWVLPR